MKFEKIIRRIHLWAGLLLGVQFVLWMASGVVMSWFHIELVRGERSMFIAPPPELQATNYASPGGVIAQANGAVSVELRSFLGRPVYEVNALGGRALFDARSGIKISPIDEKSAREVAQADFLGEGEIEKIALLNDPPREFRGRKPVWRADLNDRLHSRIYVSPDTGEVLARRNDVWRIYDFFWMLHIMDYGARTNFNNPLLKIAAAAGFLFALSGLLILVLKTGRKKIVSDVKFIFGRRRKKR